MFELADEDAADLLLNLLFSDLSAEQFQHLLRCFHRCNVVNKANCLPFIMLSTKKRSHLTSRLTKSADFDIENWDASISAEKIGRRNRPTLPFVWHWLNSSGRDRCGGWIVLLLTAKDQVRKPCLRRNLSSSAAVGGQFTHHAAAGRTHNSVSQPLC